MYAHLKEDERKLAEKFVARGEIIGTWTWDIHLAVPEPAFPAEYTEEEKEYWRKLIAKRIDGVCETINAVHIVEFTPRVSRAAIGGLLLYKDLYAAQFKPTKPIMLDLVCGLDDPTYKSLLEIEGIRLHVV